MMFPLKSLIRGVSALKVNQIWQNTGNVQCAFLSIKKDVSSGSQILPPKPKRPLTPFFRFMQDIRPQVASESPAKTPYRIIMQNITKQWEKIDDQKKEKYFAEYQKDRKVYDVEFLKYKSQITPEMKAQQKEERKARLEKRAKRELKKRNKDLGKPKRAKSAFIQFVAQERSKNPPKQNEDLAAYMRRLGAKWRTLSPAEQKPFIDVCAKEMAIYKDEIDKWEAQMLKEGNTELLRSPLFDQKTEKASKVSAKAPKKSSK